jgi:GDPmannose 4,6-dehydratase
MTRALITGITGFVGSHLADYLLANTDWEIDGLLRWRSPLDNVQALVPLVNKGERVRFFYGDLKDSESLRRCVRESWPDYVFHLAAQSYPQTSFGSACDTLDTNIQGTVRLLEALREFAPNAWIHVCSSSEVYGRVPHALLPIKEDCPFHPASPYAISKAGTDAVARFYAEAYGMNIVTTRMFTHTGPRRGDVFMESSFAKQIAMGELDGNRVIKVGNVRSIRTVADVRDAVRAYHMALTVKPVAGEVYNIGGDSTHAVADVLHTLFQMTTQPQLWSYSVDPARLRPVDADNQIPDCSKFKAATGWQPEIKFEHTMRDLLDYWRERVKQAAYLTR